MSVFGIRLDDGRVTARLKTGYLVGVNRDDLATVGGASPGAVVAGGRFIYVANATNDTITVIDAASEEQRTVEAPSSESLSAPAPIGFVPRLRTIRWRWPKGPPYCSSIKRGATNHSCTSPHSISQVTAEHTL
jgi:YVTN family beta-propeller protein